MISDKPGRIDTTPQSYPQEFRDDVVRVVLGRDKNATISQIAKDYGVHEATITKWARQAEIDDGNKPGNTTDESAELRELRRRLYSALGQVLTVEFEQELLLSGLASDGESEVFSQAA